MTVIKRLENSIQIITEDKVILYGSGGNSVHNINGKRLKCSKGGSTYKMLKEMTDDEILAWFNNKI